jgi:MFS family permease
VVIRNRTALQKAAEQIPVTGMPYAEVLRKPQFYQVACAGALTYYAILSLFSHLFLFMRSLDYAPNQASLALSTLAFAALTGKLLAGWLADRINPYRLLKWQMVLMFGGLLVITLLPGWIWAGLLLAGFGWGSLHTLYNFILLALFGLRDAGKINGSVSLCEAIGGGVGIFLTGWLHDQSGNYGFAFGVICAVLAAGVVLTAALRPVKVAAA